jgi:hypothetical protein
VTPLGAASCNSDFRAADSKSMQFHEPHFSWISDSHSSDYGKYDLLYCTL